MAKNWTEKSNDSVVFWREKKKHKREEINSFLYKTRGTINLSDKSVKYLLHLLI